MPITTINFNDLPQVVENLFNKVEGIEAMLRQLIERQPEKKETDKHIPLTVEQACEYLQMPKATFYYKVGRGEIPCIKQGKRYYIYQDELDKWLESARKIAVPQTFEEQNDAFLSGHRRKPNPKSW